MSKAKSLLLSAKSLQKKINKKGYDCDFAIFLMTKDQIMSTYEVSEMTATEVVKIVQAYLCSMSPTISEYIVDRFIPDIYSSNPITKLMDLALQMEKPKR